MTHAYGRKPHDPRKLALAPSLADHAVTKMTPPPIVDRSQVPFHPKMWSNDIYPCCTCSAYANMALGVGTLNDTLASYTFSPQNALDFYARVVNINPFDFTDLQKSDGTEILTVLQDQLKWGWEADPEANPSEILVADYANVPLTRAMLANACYLYGGVDLGVTIYQSDVDIIGKGVWNAPQQGGLEGGHSLALWDYTGLANTDTVRLVTWGGFQLATWQWIESACEEAWALLWKCLLPITQKSWLGIDSAQLEADLIYFNKQIDQLT